MYERFTDRARKVMRLANQEAQQRNCEYIGTEHILMGLVKEGSGVAATVLENLDIDVQQIRREVDKFGLSGPEGVTMDKLPQTPHAKRVIDYSIEEARNLNHNYVGTEHLLLGLLRDQGGDAAQVLINLGLELEDVRKEVRQILGMNQTGQNVESIKTDSRPGKPDPQQNPYAELQGLPAETLRTVMELDAQIEQLSNDKEEAVAECEFEKAALLVDKVRRLNKERADLIRRGQSRAPE